MQNRTVETDHSTCCGKANLTIRNVNKHLSALKLEYVENDNISSQHSGRKRLHLNQKAKSRLQSFS